MRGMFRRAARPKGDIPYRIPKLAVLAFRRCRGET